MGIGVVGALAIASVAISAGSAYISYKQQSAAAKMGEQSAALQREQNSAAARTAALNARQQENERQRRAGLLTATGRANTAAAGLDYWLSPSIQTAAGENERLVGADLDSMSLLGAANAQRYALQDRGLGLNQSAYAAAGSNAWITPTLSLLGSAANMGVSMGLAPTPSGAPAAPR